jgi:pyruvate dehydrogenase E1 component alpha subunit
MVWTMTVPFDLAGLADPAEFAGPIDLAGLGAAAAQSYLECMLLIRRVEETIADLVERGEARCPCHLAIGQEAVAAGVATHLRTSDRVLGAHRSHGHFLALGGEPSALLGEVLGKATGCSSGMGGSMHLIDRAHGLLGTVPIVAATIPIATGAALAARLSGADDIAVSFFGDGATEEGCFHESLNFASLNRLPVVFVCENNLFSSHLHITERQPHTSVARYGAVHAVPAVVVDGPDVGAVAAAAAEAVERARSDGGPSMIEAVTYRWRGHVGHREDLDVGVRREVDLALWKGRDPIARLAAALDAAGAFDREAREALGAAVDERVRSALAEARAAPYPPETLLLDAVYAPSRR